MQGRGQIGGSGPHGNGPVQQGPLAGIRVLEFSQIAAVAINHNNPCGVALSKKSLADAFRKAKACDPVSIFGGVIAFNRPVDEETAKELKEIFLGETAAQHPFA